MPESRSSGSGRGCGFYYPHWVAPMVQRPGPALTAYAVVAGSVVLGVAAGSLLDVATGA